MGHLALPEGISTIVVTSWATVSRWFRPITVLRFGRLFTFLAFDVSLSRRPSPNAANLAPLIHMTESTVAQTVANESKFSRFRVYSRPIRCEAKDEICFGASITH